MAWAPQYITKTELAAYARITGTGDDTELDFVCEGLSRAIDKACNRQFGQVAAAEARKYTAIWVPRRGRWVIPVDDLQDVTGLTVTTSAGTVTIERNEPANAVLEGLAFTRLVVDPASAVQPCGAEYEITATGKWGWNAIPNTVKLAARMQGNRLHSRRDSPYGVAGSPDQGNELRLLARLDPDVKVTLGRYVRPRRWF